VFFNTRSPIYRWYMYHIFLLKIHVSRHFTAYIPPLHWVIFYLDFYVSGHSDMWTCVHLDWSLYTIFHLNRHLGHIDIFYIIFDIFGYFLCFSTLVHRSIGGICITYFSLNFVFLATITPLYRQFIHHIFHFDKPVFHTFISM